MCNINTDPDAPEVDTNTGVSGTFPFDAYADLEKMLALELKTDVTMKGGYLLAQYIPDKARFTRDADFSISEEAHYGKVMEIFRAWADKYVALGAAASYKLTDPAPFRCAKVTLLDAESVEVADVDVSLSFSKAGSQQVMVDGVECTRHRPENILADKMSAFMSRKRFRRPRDLYDMWLILTTLDVNVALTGTLLRDNLVTDFTESMKCELGKRYAMLEIRSGMTGAKLDKPDYEEIINVILRFQSSILVAHESMTEYIWSHERLEIVRKVD